MDVWPVKVALFGDEESLAQYNLKQRRTLKLLQEENRTRYVLLDKLVTYYEQPDPHLKQKVRYLNPTLGGYLNKILSFWLIK